jgi:creatinine amidohydrolase
MSYVQMSALTWPDAEALATQDAIGLIPTGAIEQHGPALPLATDCLIAEELARRIADRIDEPVVVAPSLPGGLSTHHIAFPGTVTLPEPIFEGVIDAYVEAFARMGIRRVAIISGHGGNLNFLGRYEAKHAEKGTDTRLIAHHDLQGYIDAMFTGARTEGFDPPPTDVHAGGVETSQGLALFPELVREFKDVDGYTANEDGWMQKMFEDGMKAVSPTGVLGDPSQAPAAAGEAIFTHHADDLARWITAEVSSSIGAHSKS